MKLFKSILFFFVVSQFSAAIAQDKRVKITTPMGEIVVVLYDSTPIHRDNFLKLAEQGFYDSLLFHRVIEGFMVQGGDPVSKNAAPEAALGNGGPGYTLPAELNKGYHKRGALAAARLGDNMNPKKESSGSQFYLVQGKVFSQEELNNMQRQISNERRQKITQQCFSYPENKPYLMRILQAQKDTNMAEIQAVYKDMEPIIEKEYQKNPFVFNEEQIKLYTTLGGAPFLDGSYTVFGEVESGLEVIDKIASSPVNPQTRPLQNIWMKMEVIP